MKRFFLTTGIVCVISTVMFAQNTVSGKLTLQQCIEIGIANNLEVLQGDLQAQTDEINWKQTKTNMLPDLSATVSHGLNTGRSIDRNTNTYVNQNSSYGNYSLGSGVTIFNGFSMQNLVRQSKLAYEASKMTFQQRKDNLTLNIILAYLQVLNDEDLLVQARNQAQLSNSQVDRLSLLDKEGAIPPSQLSDVKGQYAGDQITIINAQAAVETAKIDLCQLMNVPYDKNISVERLDINAFAGIYTDTPDKIYETALQQFAQIRAVDFTVKSTEAGVKAARGRLFPTLSLNAGIGTIYSNTARSQVLVRSIDTAFYDYVIVNGNQVKVRTLQNEFSFPKIPYTEQLKNNRSTGISLDLQIPIFNGFFQRNRIKLAKLELKNSQLIAKTTKTQLQQSIEQAYISMTSASDRYKVLLQQVEAYAESFRAAEVRFNAGLGTSVDYLIAKNNMDLANINLIQAKYDYVLRTKILDYYKGVKLW